MTVKRMSAIHRKYQAKLETFTALLRLQSAFRRAEAATCLE